MQIQEKRRKNTPGGPWVNFNYGQPQGNNFNQPHQQGFGGNNAWGNTGGNAWGQPQDNGWGNQGGNNGWGNQGGNNGWGNEGGNNGWGNQGGNNGWGNQGGNNGWGNEGGNNGWGNQGGNNGWGNQGGNNGWGNEGGNNGMGNQFLIPGGFFGNRQQWGNDTEGLAWVKEQLKRQTFQIINPNQQGEKPLNLNDFSHLIEQQITFLEPSPAEKRIQELKKQGKAFYDDRFAPNLTSLTGEWGQVNEWKSIEWKKVSDTMPDAEIFKGKVEPADIKQGYLGDCYFLAALAALAERPDRIFNLFLLQKVNEVKFYEVKMLYKGKWMTIDMDQYFPFLYGEPAFSKANKSELWVMLLEKAWAKLYTSYKRIEAGYPEEALHDLTGAPIKQIYMKQANFNQEQEWNYLTQASQREYSMVASSQPGSDRNKSVSGIVQGHAYTFLNATTINFQGRQERIVQLRNPWGKGESKGKWSDSDPNWNYISQAEKDRIGFHKEADDGIFYMTWENFISEFRALTVAEINDNASYVYKSAKDKQLKGVFFKVQILQQGYYSFQVDKTPERTFPDSEQNQYQYPTATIEVGRLNGNSCQKLESFSSARRTLFKGYNLQPGDYIVKVKVDFNNRFEKDFDVNLAIYAQFACDIEYASHQQAVALTGNANVEWQPPQQQEAGPWNHMGNTAYKKGDSGWGSQGGNSNDGWGNQPAQNGGWGNQPAQNGGWGNQGGNSNDGWGNQGSGNGWGHQGGSQNDGWGSHNHSGGNNGWGQPSPNHNSGSQQQQPNPNHGWGNQPADNAWSQPKPPANDGWGNQGGSGNNGWGAGW